MICKVWYQTEEGGMILISYSHPLNKEARKLNFINAAAAAEIEAGVTLAGLTDEGRLLIDKAKGALL